MNLIRYRENPFDYLEKEINQLFGSSFGKTLFDGKNVLTPALDILEDKNNIYLEADLPGFQQKDINLNFKDDTLTISAKRENSKEEKKKDYYRCERFQGSFYREVFVPSAKVNAAKVSANYNDGVLKVVIPKKEEAKEKEIKIEVK